MGQVSQSASARRGCEGLQASRITGSARSRGAAPPRCGTGLWLRRASQRGRRKDRGFDSRITAIGLELPGEVTGFTLLSPTDSDFRLIEQVSQVPNLPDATLDFALVTGRTFGGGRPHSGLAPSVSLTTFCVSGPFAPNVPIERLLDRGVLRVQRAGADGELGDVAVWESRPQ